ncbi:helix-turn-helix domain-containing protein [Xylanimonas sp. McL0601]|uniref:helix-turn-helix domain-containing protein n=1 Tax=Xylanimonas sp. McL0601 TaxID=3414739 RepID=UPI003CF09C5F
MSSSNPVDLAALEARADSLIEAHEQLLDSLVALRKKHNLTQSEVADRMGVSQPTIAAFERDDANPTLATIRRYAHAVGARLRDEVIDDCCRTGDEQFYRVVGESFRPSPQVTAVKWGPVRV